VVLVGQWRAEEGHDPVAHHLVHRALVPVNGFHHSLEDRVKKLPRLFWIAVGEQLHRALEVGEEDRDLLALTLEGGLGREDLLGEVLGGIGVWGGKLHRRGRRRPGHRLAAFLAELRAELVGRATARASYFQPRPALLTKDGISGVLVLTPETLHSGASR
jgi:hypothetical protein